MAFLTEQEFRELYVTESATEISPAQIALCLDEAIDDIAGLCGEAVITEITDADDNSVRKVKSFRRAQGKLAYRELLFLMSSRFRDGGIVTAEKDINDSVTNQYAHFSEIEKRRDALYADAVAALKPYFTAEESAEVVAEASGTHNVANNFVW